MDHNNTIILFTTFSSVFILLCAIITILVIRRSLHLNHLHLEKNRLINEFRKMSIQEGERMMNQISKEVHDNIGQAAALAKISLHRVNKLNDNPLLEELLNNIGKQVDNIGLDASNISHSANHNYIKAKELGVLLQDDLEYMQSHRTIITDFIVQGNVRTLAPELNLLVYRIAQQAFNNILKHSGATEAIVKLEYGQQSFEMTIEDDGIGIPTHKLSNNNGIGISNMRERATLMNGNLQIKTSPNKGCSIILTVPEVTFI